MNKFYKWFKQLYYINSIKNPKMAIESLAFLNKNFKYENIKNNSVFISKENFNIMKRSFKKMLLCLPDNIDVVKYFLDADLDFISRKIDISKLENDSPIVICVVKDDLQKVKEIYKHHKKIGIKNFVYVDNGSTDGTVEFLKEQENVDIINSKTKYYTLAREAWINRVLCHYGYNNWYLVVDSDEMYNYINSEQVDIKEHIKRLKKSGTTRELSFMLDMYSNNELFSQSDDFIREYCYFDKDTYTLTHHKRFIKISGGPRSRSFEQNGEKKEFMLVKYPLFLFEKGDVQSNSHVTFPFYKNLNLECTSVLMHYKFIGNDIDKYKIRIKENNYYNGSEEYKAYIEKYESEKNTSFYYNRSQKYVNSKSLSKIDIIKELN